MFDLPVIEAVERHPSPAPEPQSIAFDGPTLWMGSRKTSRIYAIDPATWSAREETEAPGIPWGMTKAGDQLAVIYGEGADDDRVVRRYAPGRGFAARKVRAPDGTGSHLSWDGRRLYISQWYRQCIVGVDDDGRIVSTADVPHGVCGHVRVGDLFYAVTTDDEENGTYWLTRVDPRNGNAVCEDLATIPFPARGLAYDGTRFWTNHRAGDDIVSFANPDR